MRTKDEIIAAQSKLILELLRIGKDKFQEVTNLLCEIEVLPKDESITHTAKMANVVEMKDHVFKKERICPKCGIRPRKVFKSGVVSSYCTPCSTARVKEGRKS